MRILVTGGSGQLGTDVAQAATAKGWQVWAPDHTELDITHPARAVCLFFIPVITLPYPG
jgi:dTDP-4-dehydrorhamnose reductase